MRKYMDGTTSSSLLEAQLGHQKFGKETHAYSVGFTKEEVRKVSGFADKIIFNSVSQLTSNLKEAGKVKLGLRANPGISFSHFDLADPTRKFSRLGVREIKEIEKVEKHISGLMFHFNCENDDIDAFSGMLENISNHYGHLLNNLEWASLGGGLSFTKPGYPIKKFCSLLKNFSEKHRIQVYLEPGEAAITDSTELVTTVLDVVKNDGLDIAIVDASIEAHMLDLLIYRQEAKLDSPAPGKKKTMIAGRSCLAGDIFGTYRISKQLKAGDRVIFKDAAGYTMVKKNWFNGLPMPSIAVRKLDGSIHLIKKFTFDDYKNALS